MWMRLLLTVCGQSMYIECKRRRIQERLICLWERLKVGYPKLWKDLYVSLIRTHLKYAMQAWNLHLQGNIDKIERVHRMATRIPTGFEKLQYYERFKRLSWNTLKDRRLRGYLI